MNDEMSMKRRGGMIGKPVVERTLNVLDLHFPAPAVEAMSRICACKTERNLQIFGYTILLLSAKLSRENQCNEASRLEKMYQKSSALSIRFEMQRSPFAN
jgi:hypothetical protein